MASTIGDAMQHLDLLRASASWTLILLGVFIYVLTKILTRNSSTKPPTPPHTSKGAPQPQYSEASYYDIQPLPELDLAKTRPLKLRPFKPTYHMTMALESTTLSDFIAMDSTFASRCSIRKDLIATQRHEVLAVNPRGCPAVLELYHWLVSTYLPLRFPTVYTLSESTSTLQNNVTHAILPLNLSPHEAETALELLGSNIDDEFLFLLPSLKAEDEGKYRLEAFVTCFPSGFTTRSKLNQLLADIHAPVPGYKIKLGKSMDRFFASLPIGKIIKRANWTLSTTGDLFCLAGNHLAVPSSNSPSPSASSVDARAEIDAINLSKTVLRCERQTLHRLPHTRALVFAFKTYQYPIRELRDEGSGEILAEAIDGLSTGNVPDISIYKKQVVWGDKVKAFLRGEIDIDA